MRGAKPIPIALKRAAGNPGKRKLPQEPIGHKGIPEKPKHLEGEAKKEWERIGKELDQLGLLQIVDRAALAAYCQAWARWVEAEKNIKELGLVVDDEGAPIPNPYLKIADTAMNQMRAFLTEFGMTPSSRVRLGAISGKAVTDPVDEALFA